MREIPQNVRVGEIVSLLVQMLDYRVLRGAVRAKCSESAQTRHHSLGDTIARLRNTCNRQTN